MMHGQTNIKFVFFFIFPPRRFLCFFFYRFFNLLSEEEEIGLMRLSFYVTACLHIHLFQHLRN
jgi:hypothetical protein